MGNALKVKGRAVRARALANRKNDATLDGVKPRKGLWLVHRERGRVYGQIVMVRRNGLVVVYHPRVKTNVEHAPEMLIEGGYSYVKHARICEYD